MITRTRAPHRSAWLILPVLILLASPLAASPEQPPALPDTTHPLFSLYFSEADIPRLRQSITDGPQQRMWELLRDDCDAYLDGPGFGDLESELVEGSSIGSYLRLGLRMKALSLAYVISGDRRYADSCRALMLEACDVTRWVARAHTRQAAEFETGALIQAMVTALDWLNQSLTDEERQRIIGAIVEKGMVPAAGFLEDCVSRAPSSYARFMRTNNHFAVLCCGFGTAALALRGIDPRAEAWLDLSIRGVEQFIGTYGYGLDGSYREGALYWSFTTSALLRFLDPLKRLTGHDLLQHHRLTDTLKFRLLLQSPAYSPHAAVNFMDSVYERALPAMAILRLAAAYRDRSAIWFYERLFDEQPALLDQYSDDVIFSILWYDRSLTAQPPTYPLEAHFPDIDWIVLRSGWQEDATMLAFKSGGWLYSHDHPDRNSFLIEAFGERLAVDSGCGHYGWPEFSNWQRRTLGHNTLLIDGSGQHRISQGGQPSKLEAEILTFQPGGPYTYFNSDATGAYPMDLKRFQRHLLFVDTRYVVIIDELRKEETPSTFTWLLHTDNRDGATTIDRLADDEILIDRPRAGLLLKVVTPGLFEHSVTTGSLDRHRSGSLALSITPGQGRFVAPDLSSFQELQDGGFEQSTRVWSSKIREGGAQATTDGQIFRSAPASLKLAGRSSASRVVLAQRIPIVGGLEYTLSVHRRTRGVISDGHGATVRLWFADDHQRRIGGYHYLPGLEGTHDWTPGELSLEAPAAATTLSVEPTLHHAAGEAWFDDISLSVDPHPIKVYPRQMEMDFFTLLYPFPRGEAVPRFETVTLNDGLGVRITSDRGCDTIGFLTDRPGSLDLAGTVSDAAIAAVRTVGGEHRWIGFQEVTRVTMDGRTVFASDTPVGFKMVFHSESRTCHLHSDRPVRVSIADHTGELLPCDLPFGGSVATWDSGRWHISISQQ